MTHPLSAPRPAGIAAVRAKGSMHGTITENILRRHTPWRRSRPPSCRQQVVRPYRIHTSRTAGASLAQKGAAPAAPSSMNARGSGAVSRETRDLTKFVEGFAKPGEGKSKSLGRKFKARGSEIQASFFREPGLFRGLRANPNFEPLFLS